jgi:hypothetical protein
MSLPTIVYPISYTLIDTFLVVFIKATSVHGKTAYNTITANAITECIKLSIAIYISYNEGSLHTLRGIVTNPGLMVRFAVPNLMYAVNNNLFHYSVGALPPALFVVAINAFRTIFTALLQPWVSNKSLTMRQLAACLLLVFSFVCASLPEVIKAAFAGSVRGSTFELLIYLSSVYSIISVVASLSQEKLLKDSKSLMVANIINYSIGIGFQVSGLAYEKYHNPNIDLFRGMDNFWVRAIPCLMACVGLSISFVLRYYDNIVKLICSSVSVLLVNSIASVLAGETLFNIYFLFGWLLTLPATYLYYIAPNPVSAEPAAVKLLDQLSSPKSVAEENSSEKADKKTMVDKCMETLEMTAAKKKGMQQELDDTVLAKVAAKSPPVLSRMLSSWSIEKGLFGLVISALLISSILTSNFEINSVEKNKGHSSRDSVHSHGGGSSNHPMFSDIRGTEELEDTCSLFEVPFSDSKSNLRAVESYSTPYTAQYSTVDFVTGDVFVSCSKDIFIMGPDSAEYEQLMKAKAGAPSGLHDWRKLDSTQWVIPSNYDSVRSLLAVQTGSQHHATGTPGKQNIEERSRKLLADGQFKQLPWSTIDSIVGTEAMYFWVHCSDEPDANLITRPPVLSKSPQPPQGPFTDRDLRNVDDYIRHLSVGDETNKPRFDTVLVLYLDAISRQKFHQFYQRTMKVLKEMIHQTQSNGDGPAGEQTNEEFAHTAIPLERYHAVGINSEKNYPQFLSGVSTYDTKRYFTKYDSSLTTLADVQSKHLTVDQDIKSRREPWLFDLAVNQGFATSAGVTNCPKRCNENCYEKSKTPWLYELGGYHAQYMLESVHTVGNDKMYHMPGEYNFPTSAYCEPQYRPSLVDKSCSTCDQRASAVGGIRGGLSQSIVAVPEPSQSFWVANKLGMSHVLDWWRVWLASTASNPQQTVTKPSKPRFGVVVLEETHMQEFMESVDQELAQFIEDLLRSADNRNLFGTQNLAMVIMSDHGLHFTSEFKVPTGKIANKQPFNYLLLPKQYLYANPTETEKLLHNSKALTTPFDLRATVQYWLTGRDWSADVVQHKQQPTLSGQDKELHDALRQQVFASKYGTGLMNQQLPYNRTCDMAGVPIDFCGCNLQPCDGAMKYKIRNSAKDVIGFINNRISKSYPQTISVCRPLEESQLIFVPGFDDCLSSGSTVVTNAYIKRDLRLISITYVPDKDGELQVHNVNTISNYGQHWAKCSAEMAERKIDNNIQDEDYQFCLCEESHSILSTLAGIVNALNF